MISLLQRVSHASVSVDGAVTGSIGRGLLVFLAVQSEDSETTLARMVERVLTYRIFPDEADRMNRSVLEEQLELLVVPQFTLAARYFQDFLTECRERLTTVESGVFGANMKVSLLNDGPVTFWLEA